MPISDNDLFARKPNIWFQRAKRKRRGEIRKKRRKNP